jgi:hypothetical protein
VIEIYIALVPGKHVRAQADSFKELPKYESDD